jgi:hypothetical protein
LLSEGDAKDPEYEIVGVVGDAKYDSLRKEIVPTAYLPMGPEPGSFEIRAAMDPKAAIPTIRQVVAELDSNLVLLNAKTQIEQIDQALYQERLLADLSSLFGALALVLACIGLYGLLSYEVSRRTHEIGIRMALGAEQRNVLRLFISKGIALACSLAVGIAVALGVTRYVEALLYGVRPVDPPTLICVAALLLAVAGAACYVAARRAMRVDPMVALRYEWIIFFDIWRSWILSLERVTINWLCFRRHRKGGGPWKTWGLKPGESKGGVERATTCIWKVLGETPTGATNKQLLVTQPRTDERNEMIAVYLAHWYLGGFCG